MLDRRILALAVVLWTAARPAGAREKEALKTRYFVSVLLLDGQKIVVPPHRIRVHLSGLKHSAGLMGPLNLPTAADPIFTLVQEEIVPDRYQLIATISDFAHQKTFNIVLAMNGQLLRDPAARTQFPFSPPAPATTSARLQLKNVLPAHVFLHLDCPSDNTTDITAADVVVGGVRFVTGSGPGVLPWLERTYRSQLQPGTHTIQVRHAFYQLPPGTPPLVVDATLVERRIALVPPASAITKLTLRTPAQLATVSESLTVEVLPPHAASQVKWTSSNPAVLRHEGTAGTFKALAPGLATLTATYKHMTASLVIPVRANAQATMLRPIRPDQIEFDTTLGRTVIRGEAVVVTRPEIKPEDRNKLWAEHRLTVVGHLPPDTYQLSFDPTTTTLSELLERLKRDLRVRHATPHAPVETHSVLPPILPHKPPATTSTNKTLRYWSLHKIEAFSAFGVLRSLAAPRVPQTIVFIDKGLYVGPNGVTDLQLDDVQAKTRIDWRRSHPFTHYSYTGPADLDCPLQPSDSANTRFTRHGNLVAALATGQWHVTAFTDTAIGIDPLHHVVMLKVATDLHIKAALLHARSLGDATTRVLNISMGNMYDSMGPGPGQQAAEDDTRAHYLDPLSDLLKQDRMLVVVSSGDHDASFRTVTIGCSKALMTAPADAAAARERMVLVGGTMLLGGSFTPPFDPLDREESWIFEGGSGHDPAGPLGALDIAAPAHNIFTSSGTERMPTAGTSESAAMVSGVAAMLFSILPADVPARRVKEILLKTADRITYLPHGPLAPPAPKLVGWANRGIGEGRLNMWQALLCGLNEGRTDAVRWVGLRLTADIAGRKIYLEKTPADTQPAGDTLIDSDTLTVATRVTVTNRGGGELPELLVLRENANGPPVFRQRLPLDSAAIDKLAPKFVLTRRMFTRGKVSLTLAPPDPSPDRVPLRIQNLPPGPTAVDFLEPQRRYPKDPSLKPWMNLKIGDSFALSAKMKSGPPGLAWRFLDAGLKPLPPLQVEHGLPYVSVPFKDSLIVNLAVTFPAAATVLTAELLVEIFSLNNELVNSAQTVTARAAAIDEGLQKRPPGWWVESLKVVGAPPGNAAWKPTWTAEPAGWTGHAELVDPRGRVSRRKAPGGEIAFPDLFVRLFSPAGAAPGSRGTLRVAVTSGTVVRRFNFLLELALPHVQILCADTHAEEIEAVPGHDAVRARFPIQIANRSPFDVFVRGTDAQDALLPAHPPPAPLIATRVWLKNQAPDPPWVEERPLAAGQTVHGLLDVVYRDTVAALPAGTIGTRRVHLWLRDPLRPPAEIDASPRYPSGTLTVTTVLRPKPGGVS